MKRVQIVCDLAFGDGGKGVVTDNLVRECPTTPLVVRFSGGPQAAHTVVHGDQRHVFSSFGSGTLSGAPSYFSRHTCISLVHLFEEWRVLKALGANPELYIDPLATLITPADIAWNRVKERNVARHGSCGKGIGAAMQRNISSPLKTYAVDLLHPEALQRKLEKIRAWYISSKLVGLGKEDMCAQFDEEYDEQYHHFADYLGREYLPFTLQSWSQILAHDYEHVIFEGSQGILLDMDHGFFPHVTYANTTSKNVWELLKNTDFPLNETNQYYVTRCYLTRHGIGWMPNEDADMCFEDLTNVHNEWQESLRFGEIDYDLLNYALEIDRSYHPTFCHTENIVLTCLDQRPDFEPDWDRFPASMIRWTNHGPESGKMKLVLPKHE